MPSDAARSGLFGLEGVGVAVTRPGDSAGRLGELLSEVGAVVVHWPGIRFAPPADPGALRAAVAERTGFDWLVITSPRAARTWIGACRDAEASGPMAPAAGADRPGRPAVAAVGPATAALLRDAGWPVDRVPETHSAKGLVQAFSVAGDAPGARILFPCSDRAGDALPAGLERLGARVTPVVAYRTVGAGPDPKTVLRAIEEERVRVVTFTSPSTVEGFLSAVETDREAGESVRSRLAAAAIGPTTAAALSDAGWSCDVAGEATLEGLRAAAARAARRGSAAAGEQAE